MTEIALLVVIALLVGLLAWEKHMHHKERTELTDALISRSATELAQIKAVRKMPEEPPDVPPDLTRVEDISDDRFDKMISEINA